MGNLNLEEQDKAKGNDQAKPQLSVQPTTPTAELGLPKTPEEGKTSEESDGGPEDDGYREQGDLMQSKIDLGGFNSLNVKQTEGKAEEKQEPNQVPLSAIGEGALVQGAEEQVDQAEQGATKTESPEAPSNPTLDSNDTVDAQAAQIQECPKEEEGKRGEPAEEEGKIKKGVIPISDGQA